jgi:hypothetical protein
MVEFDAEAYNAASNLFKSAAMVRRSLPSIIDQIADSTDMLGIKPPDGMPRQKHGENHAERHMVEHVDLMDRLNSKRDEYRRIQSDCEAVVETMEDDCDDNGAFLRYHFMQGMTQGEAAQRCGYVRDYGKEKSEIAIVHAAKYVRKLGLVGRYS